MSIAEDLKFWNEDAKGPLPLRRWLWRSYLRSAIVPLLVIELSFLAIYWASNAIVYRQNVAAVRTLSYEYLHDIARRESMSIGNRLSGISNSTGLFARQTLAALNGNHQLPASEKKRYGPGVGGGLRTLYDNGTTASFYSNLTTIGPEQMSKVWKLSALDPLMMDLKRSDADIASLYFNTFDSYNRIYPYFDVASQYPPDMDIPSYNFYYEADRSRNPSRIPVWTDAYIDPAGHGWMVSSIAPVWRRDKLEGVVGIDVTLTTMINRLNKLEVPWQGYALLVDRVGGIIAMPPSGERDFGLRELTSHSYSQAITSDTFKPDSFNIYHRADTRALAEAMRRAPEGVAEIDLANGLTASFATVPGPGWRLVIIAPNSQIFAEAEALSARLRIVGVAMLLALLVFYVVFLALLFRRARAMSARVAAPLQDIAGVVERIGAGEYRQSFAGSQVTELDDLGHRMVDTGEQLGSAHERISQQERIVSDALARQQQVNEDLGRFVRTMSHELRTPLAVIDSGAQIIGRKADVLSPDALRDRATRVRGAVRRISDLLHTLVGAFDREDEDAATISTEQGPLVPLIRGLAADIVPADRLDLQVPHDAALVADVQSWSIALRSVLDNAVRYSPPATPIRVTLELGEAQALLVIVNEGRGIAPSELPQIGSRFFRGSTSTGIEGAGVGLYVARRIIHSASGSMDIASNLPGTRVTIRIPVSKKS